MHLDAWVFCSEENRQKLVFDGNSFSNRPFLPHVIFDYVGHFLPPVIFLEVKIPGGGDACHEIASLLFCEFASSCALGESKFTSLRFKIPRSQVPYGHTHTHAHAYDQ